jgi:hypothetical protein
MRSQHGDDGGDGERDEPGHVRGQPQPAQQHEDGDERQHGDHRGQPQAGSAIGVSDCWTESPEQGRLHESSQRFDG